MKRFLAAVGATFAAEAALGVAILYFGLAPVAADQPPSALEARVLGVALRQAVLRRTSGAEGPAAPSDEDLALLDHQARHSQHGDARLGRIARG